MSVTNEQWVRLSAILREGNLDRIFQQEPDFLKRRVADFQDAYAKHMRGVPKGVLPASVSLGDLLDEYDRNPHRVHALLQAIAFVCSPDMLAMMWMVLLGSDIAGLQYEYVRKERSHLSVSLRLPDHETMRKFESDDHWDVAVLRLVALSKVGGDPMIENFNALYIPRRSTVKPPL